MYGGIYDINFGAFGPEYVNGAFQARLHFQERGKIYVTVKAESDFEKFGVKNIASETLLYFLTEPALLDNFINEFEDLGAEKRNNAALEGLVYQWA